jgi:hypothetical protein
LTVITETKWLPQARPVRTARPLWCLPLTAAGLVLPPAFGSRTFTPASSDLLGSTVVLLAISVGVLAVAVAITQTISVRRS